MRRIIRSAASHVLRSRLRSTPARLGKTLSPWTATHPSRNPALGSQETARTTAINLFIPVLPDLREILDASANGHLMFLVTEFGKPFRSRFRQLVSRTVR